MEQVLALDGNIYQLLELRQVLFLFQHSGARGGGGGRGRGNPHHPRLALCRQEMLAVSYHPSSSLLFLSFLRNVGKPRVSFCTFSLTPVCFLNGVIKCSNKPLVYTHVLMRYLNLQS